MTTAYTTTSMTTGAYTKEIWIFYHYDSLHKGFLDNKCPTMVT